MKKLEEMSNKELKKVNRILLVIVLILEIATIIENIVLYDSYSLAVIILASLAIVAFIINIIDNYYIDEIKRDKRLKKR